MVDIASRPVILKIYFIAGSWTKGGRGGGTVFIEIVYRSILH